MQQEHFQCKWNNKLQVGLDLHSAFQDAQSALHSWQATCVAPAALRQTDENMAANLRQRPLRPPLNIHSH